ncbi:hypothetical protein FRC17_004295, partial [Serendipita sp. 399]
EPVFGTQFLLVFGGFETLIAIQRRLYGALRDNHGLYNVTLDGETVTRDGLGTGLYKQVLFGAENLTPGPHSITLTNNRNSTLLGNRDLDYITWEEELGTDEDTVPESTVDDVDPSFVYGPTPQAWNPDNQAAYSGGTGHTALSATSFVTYTFNGSAVSIFGVIGPSQGPYTVQLDSNPQENYTAASTIQLNQQLLYRATGLSDGVHTVRLSNAPAKAGQALTIDFARMMKIQVPIVTTTSTTSSETSTSTSETTSAEPTETSAPAASSGKSISTGAIVAIVVAGFALMAMLSFALMMYRRRKNSRKDSADTDYYTSKPDMTAAFPEPYTYTFGENQDDHTQASAGGGRYIPPSVHMQGGYNPLDSTSTSSHQHTPLYPPNRGPYDMNRRYSQPLPPVPPPQQQQQQQGYFGQGGQADGVSLFSGYAPGLPRPRAGSTSATTAGIAGVGGARQRVNSAVSSGGGLPYDQTDVSATAPYGAYTAASEGSSRRPELGHGSSYEPPLPPLPQQYQQQQQPVSPNGQSPPLMLHTAPPVPPGLIPPRKGQPASLPPSASVEQREEFRGVSEEELRRRRMNVEGREQDFGPLMVGVDDDANAPLPPDYTQATEAFKK